MELGGNWAIRPLRMLTGYLGNQYSLPYLGLGGALRCGHVSAKAGTVECKERQVTAERMSCTTVPLVWMSENLVRDSRKLSSDTTPHLKKQTNKQQKTTTAVTQFPVSPCPAFS